MKRDLVYLLENMVNGQEVGLAHFNGGKSYANIAVCQNQKMHRLKYEMNGEIIEGDSLSVDQKVVYFRTCVGFDNIARFQYSTNSTKFKELGGVYQLKPANFRGNMIGIYTYNDEKEAGYIDWFHYQIVNNRLENK